MFIQSWCGICNRWAPNLIKQVEATYADSRDVYFVVLKTDGGGASEALKFWEGLGADSSRWFVGSDENATLYKFLHGKVGLWDYTLITPDGNISYQGKIGSFSRGSSPTQYILAKKDRMQRYFGGAKYILSEPLTLNPKLQSIVQKAELGMFDQAIIQCEEKKRVPDLSQEVANLQQEIVEIANSRLKKQTDLLRNNELSWNERFLAYQTLSQMVSEMNRIPSTNRVKPFLVRVRTHPEIIKQLNAKNAYQRAVDHQDPARKVGQLNNVVITYPDTYYGEKASEMLAELSN